VEISAGALLNLIIAHRPKVFAFVHSREPGAGWSVATISEARWCRLGVTPFDGKVLNRTEVGLPMPGVTFDLAWFWKGSG
jgi:hypothetical protein